MGCYTYKSGDVYTGCFQAGAKHGYGRYAFTTGDVYEGHYQSGTSLNANNIIHTYIHTCMHAYLSTCTFVQLCMYGAIRTHKSINTAN